MEVKNTVVPNEEQMNGFLESSHDKPIYMLNMLKFKEKAEYEDGRDTDLTGAEAYAIYGQEVAKLLFKHGGSPMFSAQVERLMLGEVDDLWDMVAIAMYPNRHAMLDMVSSEDYQKISVHRTAGLEGQLNIETIDPNGLWLADGAPAS